MDTKVSDEDGKIDIKDLDAELAALNAEFEAVLDYHSDSDDGSENDNENANKTIINKLLDNDKDMTIVDHVIHSSTLSDLMHDVDNQMTNKLNLINPPTWLRDVASPTPSTKSASSTPFLSPKIIEKSDNDSKYPEYNFPSSSSNAACVDDSIAGTQQVLTPISNNTHANKHAHTNMIHDNEYSDVDVDDDQGEHYVDNNYYQDEQQDVYVNNLSDDEDLPLDEPFQATSHRRVTFSPEFVKPPNTSKSKRNMRNRAMHYSESDDEEENEEEDESESESEEEVEYEESDSDEEEEEESSESDEEIKAETTRKKVNEKKYKKGKENNININVKAEDLDPDTGWSALWSAAKGLATVAVSTAGKIASEVLAPIAFEEERGVEADQLAIYHYKLLADQPRASHVVIGANSIVTVPYVVKGNKSILWRVRVKQFDVRFSVKLRRQGIGGAIEDELIPSNVVYSHESVVGGHLEIGDIDNAIHDAINGSDDDDNNNHNEAIDESSDVVEDEREFESEFNQDGDEDEDEGLDVVKGVVKAAIEKIAEEVEEKGEKKGDDNAQVPDSEKEEKEEIEIKEESSIIINLETTTNNNNTNTNHTTNDSYVENKQLILTFDNSYSSWRSKEVAYQVLIGDELTAEDISQIQMSQDVVDVSFEDKPKISSSSNMTDKKMNLKNDITSSNSLDTNTPFKSNKNALPILIEKLNQHSIIQMDNFEDVWNELEDDHEHYRATCNVIPAEDLDLGFPSKSFPEFLIDHGFMYIGSTSHNAPDDFNEGNAATFYCLLEDINNLEEEESDIETVDMEEGDSSSIDSSDARYTKMMKKKELKLAKSESRQPILVEIDFIRLGPSPTYVNYWEWKLTIAYRCAISLSKTQLQSICKRLMFGSSFYLVSSLSYIDKTKNIFSMVHDPGSTTSFGW